MAWINYPKKIAKSQDLNLRIGAGWFNSNMIQGPMNENTIEDSVHKETQNEAPTKLLNQLSLVPTLVHAVG